MAMRRDQIYLIVLTTGQTRDNQETIFGLKFTSLSFYLIQHKCSHFIEKESS